MSGSIRAIETRYAGRRFRSRVEARWAVFFDCLNIRWDYEQEGFDLSGVILPRGDEMVRDGILIRKNISLPSGTWYLPDFWLPELQVADRTPGAFFEVKGETPTDKEEMKATALQKASGKPVIISVGSPRFGAFEAPEPVGLFGPWDMEKGWGWKLCPSCKKLKLELGLGQFEHTSEWKSNWKCECGDPCLTLYSYEQRLRNEVRNAVETACGCRFENNLRFKNIKPEDLDDATSLFTSRSV